MLSGMAQDVRLNPKAQETLDGLHATDPETADMIEDVLDQLEDDPKSCEHEPYPHDRGAAFVAHVLGSTWYVAWVYAPGENGVVLVGRIFTLDDNPSGGGGLGSPGNATIGAWGWGWNDYGHLGGDWSSRR